MFVPKATAAAESRYKGLTGIFEERPDFKLPLHGNTHVQKDVGMHHLQPRDDEEEED